MIVALLELILSQNNVTILQTLKKKKISFHIANKKKKKKIKTLCKTPDFLRQ